MYFRFVFIFFLTSFIHAQTVEKVWVRGLRDFSQEDIIRFSGVSGGSRMHPAITDSMKKRIRLNLIERGYFNSRIINDTVEYSQDSLKSTISLHIIEGEPAYINRIIISGTDSTDHFYAARQFDLLEGEVFNRLEIEKSISSLLDYYEEHGHPYARLVISSVYTFRDSLKEITAADIHIKIDKGKVSRIDHVEISGNSKTKSSVILRSARINTGKLYSQKEFEEIPKKLNRLRFFEPVENPSFYFNSRGEGVMLINVREKETNNFDGLIGYVPGVNNNEKGYVTGLVNISLRNIFGSGRGAALRWQKLDRYSQELEIRYLEPWIAGFPFNVNGGLFQRKQDTSYVQRRLDGAIEFMATDNISASFLLSTESVIPTESPYAVFSVYNSSAFSTGVNLKIDSRDDYYSPREGIYFQNTYLFSRKSIKGPAKYLKPGLELDVSLQKIALDFSIFRELFSRQVFALSIHGRELKGKSFEVSDLFLLGGTNSLRGYRENQFMANRLLWSNLEYRFLLSRRSYAFAFSDNGYYLRNEEAEKGIARSSGFKMGYGLGLNIETGLGVLSVSYALAKGDAFSQGKIHFGLVNEF